MQSVALGSWPAKFIPIHWSGYFSTHKTGDCKQDVNYDIYDFIKSHVSCAYKKNESESSRMSSQEWQWASRKNRCLIVLSTDWVSQAKEEKNNKTNIQILEIILQIQCKCFCTLKLHPNSYTHVPKHPLQVQHDQASHAVFQIPVLFTTFTISLSLVTFTVITYTPTHISIAHSQLQFTSTRLDDVVGADLQSE